MGILELKLKVQQVEVPSRFLDRSVGLQLAAINGKHDEAVDAFMMAGRSELGKDGPLGVSAQVGTSREETRSNMWTCNIAEMTLRRNVRQEAVTVATDWHVVRFSVVI